MLGSPWGIEDASCPSRADPPVPTWHASAKHRFQVGPRRRPDRLREAGLVVRVLSRRTFTSTGLPDRPARPQPQRSRARRSGRRPRTWSPRTSPRCSTRIPTRPRVPPRPLRQGGRHVDRRLLGRRRTRAPRPLPDRRGRDLARRSGHDDARIRSRAIPTAARSSRSTAIGSFGGRHGGRQRRLHGLRRRRRAGRARTSRPGGCSSRHGDGSVQQALLRERLSGADRCRARSGPSNPAGYPRPRGATPFRVSLTPAFTQCTAPNRPARPAARVRLVQPAAAGVRPAHGRHAGRERQRRELERVGPLPGSPRRHEHGPDEADVRVDAIADRRAHGRARSPTTRAS